MMPLPVPLTVRPRASPRRAHRDRAHDAVAQLLLHFERQIHVIELERVVDLGNLIARKFHIDDRADDLHDFAAGH
jgi:hypothetical protein